MSDEHTYGGYVENRAGASTLSLEAGGGFDNVALPLLWDPTFDYANWRSGPTPVPTLIQFRATRNVDGGRDYVWVQLTLREVLDSIPLDLLAEYVEEESNA